MSDQDFILVDEEEKESTGADEVDKEEKKDLSLIHILSERREAAEEYFILCALYQYVPAVDRRSDRPLRGY